MLPSNIARKQNILPLGCLFFSKALTSVLLLTAYVFYGRVRGPFR